MQKKATSAPQKANTTSGKQTFTFVQGQSAQRRKRRRLPRGQTSAGLFSQFRLDVEADISHKLTSSIATSRTVSHHDDHAHDIEENRAPRGQRLQKLPCKRSHVLKLLQSVYFRQPTIMKHRQSMASQALRQAIPESYLMQSTQQQTSIPRSPKYHHYNFIHSHSEPMYPTYATLREISRHSTNSH